MMDEMSVKNITWPKGMKKTKQREEVYQILIHAKKPLSVGEIYVELAQMPNGNRYAISTVYRILAIFEEYELIAKSAMIGEDKYVYEWNQGVHKHYAICLECRKLVPLKSCPFEKAPIQEEDEDFVITGHKLEVYGYCKQCMEQKSIRNTL